MEEKKYDAVALGELLIDFTQNGTSEQGNWLMEANPGGAPCNVLAMLTKLGKKTSFIGKVGNDMFGKMLCEKIKSIGIGTENLVLSSTEKTTLAFVHTAPDGDRSFSFYRNPGADASLEKNEISEKLISSAKIFHYGTLSMTNSTVNEATEYALTLAEKHGILRSFDPNLRLMLWDNKSHAKERILYGISKCSMLKIAEEELEFITGKNTIPEGINFLKEKYNIPLSTVTKGKKGSCAFFSNGNTTIQAESPTFTSVKTIDTTGAGDTFCACMIYDVLEHGIENFTSERLKNALCFANAAASLVTTKKGALCVMPSLQEISNLLNK